MGERGLVEQVRAKLFPVEGQIESLDEAANDRIERDIIPSAKVELAHLLGLPDKYEFDEPGTELSLLINLCFYMWHDAYDDFEVNYAPQIARCREKWAVISLAEEEQTA